MYVAKGMQSTIPSLQSLVKIPNNHSLLLNQHCNNSFENNPDNMNLTQNTTITCTKNDHNTTTKPSDNSNASLIPMANGKFEECQMDIIHD